jgi:hypothetical protein
MTRKEFESWWLNQETFDDNPLEKNEIMEMLKKSFNEPYKPEPIWVFEWPDKILEAESEEMSKLWLELDESRQYNSVISTQMKILF